MTDETQEPGTERNEPQGLPISEEWAQQIVDDLHDEDRENARDMEAIKLIIGKEIANQERVRETINILEGIEQGKPSRSHIRKREENYGELTPGDIAEEIDYLRRAEQDQQDTIMLYSDLARGVPLVESIRKSPNNIKNFIDRSRNMGSLLRLHREKPLDRFKGCLGSVAGGVEYEFRPEIVKRYLEGEGGEEFIRVTKERALERAGKLDEELRQK